MNTTEAVIKRIDELCIERQLSLYQLAYRGDIPRSTLTNLMSHPESEPKLISIARICRGFNITMREFFDSAYFDECEADED